jgi:hypothetical protein
MTDNNAKARARTEILSEAQNDGRNKRETNAGILRCAQNDNSKTKTTTEILSEAQNDGRKQATTKADSLRE